MTTPTLLAYLVALLAAGAPDYPQARRIPDLAARREALAAILDQARATGDSRQEAAVLLDSASAANSLGKYRDGAKEAAQAAAIFRRLNDSRNLARARNMEGNARLYLGEYAAALSLYEQSLEGSRKAGDREQSVYRLNNIGSVHLYQARYAAAWRSFLEARQIVDQASGERWHGVAFRRTAANQATLLQRTGKDREALAIYRQLLENGAASPPAERAQMLSNLGVIYRRLGDPVKAVELYREALAIFDKAQNVDGRLGVLKNIAIIEALELDDLRAAEITLQEMMRQGGSSNVRERLQARLYLAEVRYLRGALPEAAAHWQGVLAESRSLDAAEEEWKALYGLGRIELRQGRREQGIGLLREAVRRIDRVRLLTTTGQRRDLLAGKRDVFDTMLEALSENAAAPDNEWFQLRGWAAERDRPGQTPDETAGSVPVAKDEAILYYWIGDGTGAVVWITAEARGLVRFAFPDSLRRQQNRLAARISQPGAEGWKESSAALGRALFSGIPAIASPLVKRLVIVPDTAIAALPFDALTLPGGALVAERFEVAMLPMLRMKAPPSEQPPLFPWSRTALVVSGVPFTQVRGLPGDEMLPPLPLTVEEGRMVAASAGGRVRNLTGRGASKTAFLREAGQYPILHIATHAITDPVDAARSRLLLADEPLYLNDVRELTLPATRLAVLSACGTGQGAEVWGVGLESLGMAFLRAGTRTVIGTLWPVQDRAAAGLMRDFYAALARGEPAGRALHLAKRARLAEHPSGWAGFVLFGNPEQRIPAAPGAAPWFGGATLAAAGLAGVIRFRKARAR